MILRDIVRQKPMHSANYDFPPGVERLRHQIARRALAAGCRLSLAGSRRKVAVLRSDADLEVIPRGALPLIKIHGSIDEPDSIITTLQQVGRGLTPSKGKVLKRLLNRDVFLFLGWSDSDIDLSPALMGGGLNCARLCTGGPPRRVPSSALVPAINAALWNLPAEYSRAGSSGSAHPSTTGMYASPRSDASSVMSGIPAILRRSAVLFDRRAARSAPSFEPNFSIGTRPYHDSFRWLIGQAPDSLTDRPANRAS
jgi:hypothetical protein